ncbi:glycosyl hydrolase 2 galactose-binding domain-containing protein [Microbispora sp. ATCC PTA-5024]|uniref:glycosyl hydrolase 2 galactose-binding domain-containing protein n=1 Tax=Microbispora sp. ATCC PTA-5024 TaxID=316330 RepID=UPI0003DC94BD|nr:carbohydrate-binding protein [Microbispora sp. ATCC PTA-5024]ETK37029.1 exo-beta-D-glucosaminidase [Microbispora sp. ATCC PTA-5024]
MRSLIRLLAALALTAAGVTALPAAASQAAAQQPVVLPGYKIQSSAKVSDGGAAISTPGYGASGWYAAGPRSTVLAALLKNGVYSDPFYSTNMKSIPAADFTVPWWYRSDFTLGSETGLRTFLDVTGLISGGDVWVNGAQVAAGLTGAYTRNEIDVTSLVHAGVNSVAFKVSPNDPNKQLTMGWIDWVQTPPDKNMGIFRDVVVRRSGAVALRDAHVVTSLTAALDRADLTVKVNARNDGASAVTATIAGTAAGMGFSQDVSLAAHQTKTVSVPLTIASPKVWWPYGMGGQPLYDLSVTATVGGTVSDTASSTFGVRSVTSSLDGGGHRLYKINGRPLLVRGGGWSPDLFLRWDPQYVRDKLEYVRDLGLNTIRLEGHLEPDDLFDLTDRMGILVMAGWECCDKWEGETNGSEPGDKWTSADYTVAKASMAAEAARLRDHPSVFTFLIGSDFAPNGTQESGYLDALNAADWKTPVVAAASDNSSPQLGSSGMKMDGPYDWIPPNYWYTKQLGGAFGFASEVSAGPDVPTLDSLKRMMSSSELNTLWQNASATQYHRSPSDTFGTLKLFDDALTGRYGAPSSLDDYVRKAQLAQYENTRAQFEAFGRNFTDSANPATGVIYWMLNSGWSSLHWQLFDTYLDQGGSYWGTRKAMTPLHVQYSYDNRSVVVVNSTHKAASGLTVKTDVFNLDGTNKYSSTATVTAPADGGRVTAVTVPSSISGLNTTYLLRLTLSDASGEIDRNVYWLSTAKDVLDYGNSDWYYTPTTSYADLKGLAGMARAPISVTATSPGAGTATVTVTNTGTGKLPAFYLDAHVVDAAGKPVLPAIWSDNAISLWPGESKTLTVTFRGAATGVRVAGWNTATATASFGSPAARDYQAEDATLSQAGVFTNHTGYTGTGFVDYTNVAGSYVEWTVDAASAGPATLTFRYANGTTADRPMDIAVNGTVVAARTSFAATANWDTWATVSVPVTLAAGTNRIRATATATTGGPNVDKLTVG